jgi:hypothetical protein
LEKTVGDEFKRKIYDYGNEKNKELDNYIKHHSSPKCVKFMHEKLLTYLKFMTWHNKGTLSFTYGEDIHCNMTDEEIDFMGHSYEISIL